MEDFLERKRAQAETPTQAVEFNAIGNQAPTVVEETPTLGPYNQDGPQTRSSAIQRFTISPNWVERDLD